MFIVCLYLYYCWSSSYKEQGRIQDIKLGGGGALKKLRRAEGGAKILGVFRVKNHDYTPKKIIIFPILGGGGGGSPPGSAPEEGVEIPIIG